MGLVLDHVSRLSTPLMANHTVRILNVLRFSSDFRRKSVWNRSTDTQLQSEEAIPAVRTAHRSTSCRQSRLDTVCVIELRHEFHLLMYL